MDRLNRARRLGGFDEWERRTDKPMLIISLVFLLVILVPVIFGRLPSWARKRSFIGSTCSRRG